MLEKLYENFFLQLDTSLSIDVLGTKKDYEKYKESLPPFITDYDEIELRAWHALLPLLTYDCVIVRTVNNAVCNYYIYDNSNGRFTYEYNGWYSEQDTRKNEII
jgi:hypothetical protein